VPALTVVWPSAAATAAALFIVAWTATVHLWRPTFDSSSVGVFVVVGLQLNFAIIYLVSRHEHTLLAPVRWFLQRPTENGFAARLAVAYPTSRRFRTGATMAMYALVVSMIVLIGQINAILDTGMASMVSRSTGGYPVRVEWNPASPIEDPERAFTAGSLADDITEVLPLVTASALVTDPGGRTSSQLPGQAVGVPSERMGDFRLDKRLDGLATDADVWARLAADPDAVLLDQNFANPGGPPGNFFGPGDTFEVLDPLTGARSTKTIVGILESDLPFNSIGAATGGFAHAMVMDANQVASQFGSGVRHQAALLRTAAGVDDATLGSQLQGQWLDRGLQSTSIATWMEDIAAANQAFFRLMEGFLALGLAVGICGLGVIMVRAVRERRRTIGVLRALGVQSATVQKAFLAESSFVAFQGIVIGVGIAILTSYLLWANASVFASFAAGFVVAWDQVALAAVGSFVLSLLATWPPARRASRIQPAIAVRVAD
jgi:putative ABC transport system permease protein